jgi:hypothetical protein
MGIKKRRILCRFQKYKLVLVTKCPNTSKSRIKFMLYYTGGLLCSKSKSLILIYAFWVHFVTNTSLYFWTLRKILRLLIPINPTVYCEKLIFDPYVLHGPKSVHLWGSGQGTKNVFKHILQTFATKWTFPSLTVVLIPISTHPNVHLSEPLIRKLCPGSIVLICECWAALTVVYCLYRRNIWMPMLNKYTVILFRLN